MIFLELGYEQESDKSIIPDIDLFNHWWYYFGYSSILDIFPCFKNNVKMKFFNKAQTSNLLKGLIIMLVILVIFLLFMARTRDVFKEKTAKQICKADVYGKAALGIKPFKAIQRITEAIRGSPDIVSEVNCPTQDVIITENLDTKEGKARAKYEIAKAMYDCWDQFGEGKFELFETKIIGVEMYCVMCHHITFKDKNKEINGFIDYLQSNNIPNNDITYFEYLTGFQTAEEIAKFRDDVNDFINEHSATEIHTGSDYAVTFFYYKQGYLDRVLGGMFGASVGTVAATAFFVSGVASGGASFALFLVLTGTGVALGYDKAADWKSGVMLIPLDASELEDLGCTYLPAKQSEKE